MPAPKFSNWFVVEDLEEIPVEHLPAAYWQYRWVISTDFEIPESWLGVSGGLMTLDFELAIGEEFNSTDRIRFVCVTLRDYFIGSLLAFYTYYPGLQTTSAVLDVPTFGGNQPYWVYDGDSQGASLENGFIRGWWHSPIYKLGLPVGSVVDIIKFHPSSEILGGVMLQMRTARGAAGKRRTLVDPVTSNEHLPRVVDGMLLLRTRTHDGMTGVQSGLGVSLGAITGGTVAVTVGPGAANVGYADHQLAAAATLDVSQSGSWYLLARPLTPALSQGERELEIVAEQMPVSYPSVCIGRVKNGALTSCNGVLIADDVDDGTYSPGRTEDGRMSITWDSGASLDMRKESSDRGVTWE